MNCEKYELYKLLKGNPQYVKFIERKCRVKVVMHEDNPEEGGH